MLKKMEDLKESPQQEIYHSLLSRYEKALYSLGMENEEVTYELAEFIQFYNLFK